jgi:hypothetical protein
LILIAPFDSPQLGCAIEDVISIPSGSEIIAIVSGKSEAKLIFQLKI